MSDGPTRKRNPLLIGVIVVLAVGFPFMSWYGDWMGRKLTDDEVSEYLQTDARPQDIQHALKEVVGRLEAHAEGATRWRSQLIALRRNNHPEIRRMLAWALGRDADEACRQALLELLKDDDLATRRNAALALSNWNDPTGREVLLAVLRPLQIHSPATGTLDLKVKLDSAVGVGRDMAVVQVDAERSVSLRPPMDGRVLTLEKHDGEQVQQDELIGTLSPDPNSVFEALRALYVVGRAEDQAAIRPFAEGQAFSMPERVAQQARLTLDQLGR